MEDSVSFILERERESRFFFYSRDSSLNFPCLSSLSLSLFNTQKLSSLISWSSFSNSEGGGEKKSCIQKSIKEKKRSFLIKKRGGEEGRYASNNRFLKNSPSSLIPQYYRRERERERGERERERARFPIGIWRTFYSPLLSCHRYNQPTNQHTRSKFNLTSEANLFFFRDIWKKKYFPSAPTDNGESAKWKLSRRNVYALRTRFLHVRAPACVLSRCLVAKNFCVGTQSEVCQECVVVVVAVVGWVTSSLSHEAMCYLVCTIFFCSNVSKKKLFSFLFSIVYAEAAFFLCSFAKFASNFR